MKELSKKTLDIFVPGRICLFGEHSDWAGSYRRINSKILPGEVIVTGTNQGIYAKVQENTERLVVHSTSPEGESFEPLDLPMDSETLLTHAQEGGFYSYAAGVAHFMRTFYHVRGLEINNYRTTLPLRKGLSSSAAFTVLMARAFNLVYDLKLTVRAEMEAAYQGEIRTPSRCGRMDQACAFGQVPVAMTFDGEFIHTQRIVPGGPIQLLIADLKGHKDTVKILADLNKAYPFPEDDISRNVHEFLGKQNQNIVTEAQQALEEGDAVLLGKTMTRAQKLFDDYVMPASPEQLSAPRLHEVLDDPEIVNLTYGGKGIGSQGDGCVQFVAKDSKNREQLMNYLHKQYGMDSYPLDITLPQAVRKAVIPAAGLGTRMFPASKAIKKEFFPVVTPDRTVKPVILAIVEEALSAGIEELGIIVREGDEQMFRSFFDDALAPEHYSSLPQDAKAYCDFLHDIGQRITLIPQAEQEGFGHAVYCAREWVGDEPFLLMLGDHLYISTTSESCASQLIAAYQKNRECSTVGLYKADISEVPFYGTVTGNWKPDETNTLQLTELCEKPSRDYATHNLVTPKLDTDHFLCLFGMYVLTPAIFEHLRRDIAADARERGEIQLTTALESLRRAEGMFGQLIAGHHYDTGLPEAYVHTLRSLHSEPV